MNSTHETAQCYCGKLATRMMVEIMADLTAGAVWYCDDCLAAEYDALTQLEQTRYEQKAADRHTQSVQ